MKKIIILNFPKFQGKLFVREKIRITFSEVTPNRNFTSSCRRVALHNHDMCLFSVLNGCFRAFSWKFLLSVVFFINC